MSKSMPLPPGFNYQEFQQSLSKLRKAKQYYYNEQNALHVKKILDALHTSKTPLEIPAQGDALNTLRVKYYQGRAYLLDNLDPAKQYSFLASYTKVTTKKTGLYFSIRELPKTAIPSLADFQVARNPWRGELQTFLETSTPHDKFEREIALTDEDLAWINTQLAPFTKLVDGEAVPLFFGEVTKEKILLIRDE